MLLSLVVFLVFLPTCGYQFVCWDDNANVYRNPYLNPPGNLAHFWQTSYYHLYMPITYTLWFCCARLAYSPSVAFNTGDGITLLDPLLFHAANIILHVVNVLLVFCLLQRLFHKKFAAAAGALVFGLHPCQIESVAWVTGMNNLLSATFSLLALLQFERFATQGTPPRRRRGHYCLATGAFLLALLSKPTATALPLMAFALDRGIFRRPLRSSVQALLPWTLGAGLFVLITLSGSAGDKTTIPVLGRPFIAADALAFYGGKLLLPIRMSFDYGRTPPLVLGSWWGYATWLVPAGIGGWLWLRRRQFPILGAAACFFAASLLPMLGFVPFYFHQMSTVADRYLYLAVLGPVFALTWLLSIAPRNKRRLVISGVGIGLAIMIAASAGQMGQWRDSETLFRHTLALNPRSWAAHNNLGFVLLGRNKAREAAKEFQEVAQLQPHMPQGQYHLGLALKRQGDFRAAAGAFRRALHLDPADTNVLNSLAAADSALKDFAGAQEALHRIIRLDPGAAEAYRCLGVLQIQRNDPEEGMRSLRRAVALRPDSARAQYTLGHALAQRGDLLRAAVPLGIAAHLAPDNAAFRQAADLILRKAAARKNSP